MSKETEVHSLVLQAVENCLDSEKAQLARDRRSVVIGDDNELFRLKSFFRNYLVDTNRVSKDLLNDKKRLRQRWMELNPRNDQEQLIRHAIKQYLLIYTVAESGGKLFLSWVDQKDM